MGAEENGLAVPHLARVERTLPVSALMLGKIIIQFRGGGGVMAMGVVKPDSGPEYGDGMKKFVPTLGRGAEVVYRVLQ